MSHAVTLQMANKHPQRMGRSYDQELRVHPEVSLKYLQLQSALGELLGRF